MDIKRAAVDVPAGLSFEIPECQNGGSPWQTSVAYGGGWYAKVLTVAVESSTDSFIQFEPLPAE
jgi:hypothetical protein